MRRAAALALLLGLPPRVAAAEVLDGWPCAGCVTVTPTADHPQPGAGPDATNGAPLPDAGPRPLLVALHGDGGGVRPLVRAWKAAAAAAGVVLLAPRCPRELGCRAQSFWQWYETSGHDPAWLGAQIDAVAARFPVDPHRVYATGYSGGATYLGWYAPTHATRFAAVAHVAGGAPYRPPCPACKVPVLFLLGAMDPMIRPYARPLRDWYESCGGHEIAWETLPGVTHESILQVLEAGRAKQILSWLLARPAACTDGALDAGALDAGAAPASPPEPAPLHPPEQPEPAATGTPSAPPRVPPAPDGCACHACALEAAPAPLAALLAALAIAAARLRRRAR